MSHEVRAEVLSVRCTARTKDRFMRALYRLKSEGRVRTADDFLNYLLDFVDKEVAVLRTP